MKKIFILTFLLSIFLFGCERNMQTPTSKAEEFLSSYQRLDKDVLKELEKIVEKEDEMTEEEKKEYKTLLEKQYQNLAYKIKKEIISKDTATVDVEIEVLDYTTAISKSEKDCEKNVVECKLKELKSVNNKTKHDLTITLYQEDGKWVIENLNEDDVKKLHGLY